MKSIFFFCVLSLFCTCVKAQQREEFNGPYNSWADVKKRFGAKGNGKDDDTKALQRAIDSLSNATTGFNMGKGAYTVVYLPAGTYCVSSTLVLRGKIGVSFIGEDPANTIIKWTGGDNDTIFWANGSAYYKISRFTWDAGKSKGMEGVGIHWKDRWDDGKTRSYATLNIEVSDCYFKGVFKSGISGGTVPGKGTGWNDSEITIKRCSFSDCTVAGIEITGYNALDYWIWDCRFIRCNNGVRCAYGNYHVYRSYFSGSQLSDVYNTNGYYNSVRGCYSENSSAFSLDAGVSTNPFKRIFQGNTIINPHKIAIEYYHVGKITLWDNKFTASLDPKFDFSVQTSCRQPGVPEVMSINNSFQNVTPVKILNDTKRLFSFGDNNQSSAKMFAAASSTPFLNTLAPIPAKVSRKVFEVPPGASADDIQSILNQAAGLKGQRPVVHFGMGTYTINKPLVIPPSSDMQLAGDGLLYASVLQRGPAMVQSPMLIVNGPSYITVRDLQIGRDGDKNQAAGIVVTNADQPMSQTHLDQVYASADTALYVDGLNYLYIQKDNSFFTAGNYISGGNLVQQGKGTARVSCNGGQFVRLTVRQNGRFLARDCWWEGATTTPLDLTGSGTISIDGSLMAPAREDSLPTIKIGKFNGKISLMNMYVHGALWCQPDNPNLSLLVWNIHFYHKMNVLDFVTGNVNYKGAFLGLNAQCFIQNDPNCKVISTINDQVKNVQDINSFLNDQTSQDREDKPVLFQNLPSGVSNIYISRVTLGKMDRGLVFNVSK